MIYKVYSEIYKDPNMIRYLRENSYWYKILNRNPESINMMKEEMKVKYGKRFTDKIDKVKTGLSLISAFSEVTKGE